MYGGPPPMTNEVASTFQIEHNQPGRDWLKMQTRWQIAYHEQMLEYHRTVLAGLELGNLEEISVPQVPPGADVIKLSDIAKSTQLMKSLQPPKPKTTAPKSGPPKLPPNAVKLPIATMDFGNNNNNNNNNNNSGGGGKGYPSSMARGSIAPQGPIHHFTKPTRKKMQPRTTARFDEVEEGFPENDKRYRDSSPSPSPSSQTSPTHTYSTSHHTRTDSDSKVTVDDYPLSTATSESSVNGGTYQNNSSTSHAPPTRMSISSPPPLPTGIKGPPPRPGAPANTSSTSSAGSGSGTNSSATTPHAKPPPPLPQEVVIKRRESLGYDPTTQS